MKKSWKTLALLSLAVPALTAAQTAPAPPMGDNSCASQWYWLFKERGSASIPNGMQQVAVSVKKYGTDHCLQGKIQVKDGRMVFPLYLEKEDGTFLEMKKELVAAQIAREPGIFAINNGCSARLLTTEQEEIELFFYKFLNPKPTSFKRVPSVGNFQ